MLFGFIPGGWELLIIAAIVLFLFPRLLSRPAKGVGESLGILRRQIGGNGDDHDD